jgi:transposase
MKSKTKITSQQFETYIGVDLGDKKHHVCVTDKDGVIIMECTIANDRHALRQLCQDYPGGAVALEVGAHSPWISRFLTAQGMQVTVANARKLRAIYQNNRKCDQLDARMLAKLLRADRELLSPIQHGSEQAQKDLLAIKIRASLVRQRTGMVNTLRGVIKSMGMRIPSSSAEAFHVRAGEFLTEQPELEPAIAPALKALETVTEQIRLYEKAIEEAARTHHPQALKLQQIPSIGPITSLAFVLGIEDPTRFKDPRDVGAYIGLVPRRDQSGDTDKQLPISKAGNKYLRQLLVQCAQYLIGHFGPDCALRDQGLKLVARGGKAAKKKATIAIARKLAVMMIAMWQKGSDYEAFPERKKDIPAPKSPPPGNPPHDLKTAPREVAHKNPELRRVPKPILAPEPCGQLP